MFNCTFSSCSSLKPLHLLHTPQKTSNNSRFNTQVQVHCSYRQEERLPQWPSHRTVFGTAALKHHHGFKGVSHATTKQTYCNNTESTLQGTDLHWINQKQEPILLHLALKRRFWQIISCSDQKPLRRRKYRQLPQVHRVWSVAEAFHWSLPCCVETLASSFPCSGWAWVFKTIPGIFSKSYQGYYLLYVCMWF